MNVRLFRSVAEMVSTTVLFIAPFVSVSLMAAEPLKNDEPACDFQSEDLWSIRESKLFTVRPAVATALPLDLFRAHEADIGEIDAQNCADAVELSEVTYKPSGRVYDLYFTVKDECDGGNSFGLVVEKSSGVTTAAMNDQSFTCLAQ